MQGNDNMKMKEC